MTVTLGGMRNGAGWLRRGVLMLALMIFLPLAIPAAASASFMLTTYTNTARAVSRTDFRTDFKVAYQFRHSYSTPVVRAVNRSVALTSKCDQCGATAIAFQIVLISKQGLSDIHALNVATATNDECVGTCGALALAYQIVVANDTPTLTYKQYLALRRVAQEFKSLPKSHLTIAQIQSQSQQLVNTAMSILEGGSSPAPASPAPVPAASPLSAALNGPALPSELVNDSRPIVDLYRQILWRRSPAN